MSPNPKLRSYPYFARHCNDGDTLYVVIAPDRAFRVATPNTNPNQNLYWKDVRHMPESYLTPLPNGTTILVANNE